MSKKKEYKYYVVYTLPNMMGSCTTIRQKPINNMEDVAEVRRSILKSLGKNEDDVCVILNWKELKN